MKIESTTYHEQRTGYMHTLQDLGELGIQKKKDSNGQKYTKFKLQTLDASCDSREKSDTPKPPAEYIGPNSKCAIEDLGAIDGSFHV